MLGKGQGRAEARNHVLVFTKICSKSLLRESWNRGPWSSRSGKRSFKCCGEYDAKWINNVQTRMGGLEQTYNLQYCWWPWLGWRLDNTPRHPHWLSQNHEREPAISSTMSSVCKTCNDCLKLSSFLKKKKTKFWLDQKMLFWNNEEWSYINLLRWRNDVLVH